MQEFVLFHRIIFPGIHLSSREKVVKPRKTNLNYYFSFIMLYFLSNA